MRQYSSELMSTALQVLSEDNEENGLLCLRISFELHKQYRPALEDFVPKFLDLVRKVRMALCLPAPCAACEPCCFPATGKCTVDCRTQCTIYLCAAPSPRMFGRVAVSSSLTVGGLFCRCLRTSRAPTTHTLLGLSDHRCQTTCHALPPSSSWQRFPSNVRHLLFSDRQLAWLRLTLCMARRLSLSIFFAMHMQGESKDDQHQCSDRTGCCCAVMFLINLYSRTVTARIPSLVPILVQGAVLPGKSAQLLKSSFNKLRIVLIEYIESDVLYTSCQDEINTRAAGMPPPNCACLVQDPHQMPWSQSQSSC